MAAKNTIHDKIQMEVSPVELNSSFYKDFLKYVPSFCAIFTDRTVAFYATDMEKYIMKIDPGNCAPFLTLELPLPEGSLAHQIRDSKQIVLLEVPKETYGLNMRLGVFPIFDDDSGEVIGTLGMVTTRDNVNTLRTISETFMTGLSEIAQAAQQTAENATNITASEMRLNKEIEEIGQLSVEITGILDAIRDLANETKMLGLNAAIEAARAGEVGLGFGVVAEEIRKLSESSKQTAEGIRALTQRINEKIDTTLGSSQASVEASHDQAAAAQEINASIQELTAMAERLNQLAAIM